MSRATCLAAVVWFLCAGATSLSTQETSLSVVVTDSSGGFIPQAYVLVHWERIETGTVPNVGIAKDIVGRTNGRGEFIAGLPEGFYDVFVSWRAETPFSRKVRVRPGQPTVLPVTLTVDPQIITPLIAHPVGTVLLEP